MDFKYFAQKERWIGTIFLVLFALLNVATAGDTRLPWLDEVSYSDPAVTWFLGGGFQSSLWNEAGSGFWVGNVPFHQFLLCLWLKVFGFSIYTVRSASIIYYILAVGILWSTLRRTEFLRTAATRLLFIIIALGATGCVAVYRNGRYDALGVLLVSVAVSAACQPAASVKSDLLLFGAAALLPWTGLQLLPYFGIATLFYVSVLKRAGIRRFLIGNLGMSLGILSLLAFYFIIGHLHLFISAINAQEGSPVKDILVAVVLNSTSLAMMGLGIALFFAFRNREFPDALHFRRKVASTLIALGIATPLVMYVVCKYTIYYSWMAILPCTTGVLFFWEQCTGRRQRLAVILLALLSVLPGYPRRALNIITGDTLRSEKEMERFVHSKLGRDDFALLEMDTHSMAAYYSVKEWAKNILFDAEDVIDPERARAVTAVVASETGKEWEFQKRLGGEWHIEAEMQWGPNDVSWHHWRTFLWGYSSETLVIYKRL